MTKGAGSDSGEPHFWHQIKQDLWGIGKDVGSGGLPGAARQTFQDLESFYLSDAYRLRLQAMSPVKRFLVRIWWLLKSLVFKLTPVRRVLLLFAMVCMVNVSRTGQTGDQVYFTAVNTPGLGAALLLLLLMLELKDKLVARHELEAGRAVQRALMPEGSPAIAGWDAWLYTMPANDVGGDLVDHLEVAPGRHAIALADVAGKALPAALLMAKVQSTLRALASDGASLGDFADRVNAILCRDGLPNRFVTLVYLDVHSDADQVSLVNAGHMPPIIVTPTGSHELPRGNMAMGLMHPTVFVEQHADIRPGEMLIVYSDGLTEAMNAEGDFYGDERLRALLPGLAALTAAEAGARILSSAAAFIGHARPYDDISLVILKRREA